MALSLFVLLIFTGILSFILTYAVRHIALKKSIIDIPNERSSHSVPTPRGGGIAIVISWYLGITALFYFKHIDSQLYFALLSGILLAAISLLDDLFSLKPSIRFLTQSVTAVVAFSFLKGIDPLIINGNVISCNLILYPLTIIGIVWFINLYNFLDGIDAYASVEALFITAGLFLFTHNSVNLALAASVAGFLFWNWPRAKIFMGDVGSTQLGFVLAILGIYFHNTGDFSIIYWIMLSSLFWFDATLTLFRRWRNHEKLNEAHRKHAYQRIVQAGFTHSKTVYFSMMINAIILFLIYLASRMEVLVIPVFLVLILFLFAIVRLVDRKYPFIIKS